jgi:hypothetical protein
MSPCDFCNCEGECEFRRLDLYVERLEDALRIIRDKIYQIEGAKKIATMALSEE